MKIALIITTYNRPQYLAQCLRSLYAADIPQGTTIILVDDGSNDPETIRLFSTFNIAGCNLLRVAKAVNQGIKESLRTGYELAFNEDNDCELAINLDADAIVRKDFIQVLLALKKVFPDAIVSGFNTTVLNRNPIISTHKSISKKLSGFFKKKYASGINMVINKDQYIYYIQPALNSSGNWDFNASLLHEKNGKEVIVANPSVVQHIGFNSAMGHAISEPPDVAEDFILHELPNVTLIGATSSDLKGLIRAADISSKYIKFGEVKLLTSLPTDDCRRVIIPPLRSKAEYNQFVLKNLTDYLITEHCLIIQSDGYVINPFAWEDEFLAWDYVGAVWNFNHAPYPNCHVGNGGFSLRTKRLHSLLRADMLIKPANDQYIKNFEEDHNICKIYRTYLERQYSIKFAPKEIANRFSIEAYGVKPPDNVYNESFGFHGHGNINWNGSYLENIPIK